jgi:hypothetical protein
MMGRAFISLTFLLASCAWLGSTSTLHQMPGKKMARVAVLIAQDEVFLGANSDSEHFLLTKVIAEELARRRLFSFKILDRRYTRATLNDLEASLLGLELSDRYDGYMVFFPDQTGMQVKLYEAKPNRQIITANHDTLFGNSYWFPQYSSSIMVDATRGALNAFERKWKNLK